MKSHSPLLFFASLPAVFIFMTAEKSNAVEYSGNLRDPFNFPSRSEDKTDVKMEIGGLSLTLEGLIWESDRPQAIVSGKIVEAGGRVGNAEVLEIGKKGVKMRYKDQEFWLSPKGN